MPALFQALAALAGAVVGATMGAVGMGAVVGVGMGAVVGAISSFLGAFWASRSALVAVSTCGKMGWRRGEHLHAIRLHLRWLRRSHLVGAVEVRCLASVGADLMREAIREAIRGHRRRSEAIRGLQ